jgi:APA family basic amino acid/polyamine antiporter
MPSITSKARATLREPDPLLRVMGPFGLAALIINITVGGGVFRLPANVAASLGAAAPVAYLVCAAAMGLIVRCLADAGSRVPQTGGPYAYIGVALGPYVGFLSGLLLLLVGLFAGAALATVFAANIGGLVPALGGRTAQVVVLMATLAFWSIVNMQGAALGAALNTVATGAKLLPLLLVAVGGVFFVERANFHETAWPAAANVARTSLLLVFAFGGIEVALVPSGEVRDPARTIPRAIAIAMVAVTILYLALQVSAQGLLGDQLAEATSPLADAAGVAFGEWARVLLLGGAAVSIFGALGSLTLSAPRMVFALARDGYLPRRLGTVHPRHRTPQIAIIAYAVILLVLAVSGTFERLAILTNLSALALYFGSAVAAWQLRSGAGTSFRERLRLGGLVPLLACAVIAWLLTGASRAEWLGFGTCLVIGTLIYGVARARGISAGQRAKGPFRDSAETSVIS